MKTTAKICPRCASTSCRSEGSPACRERARKAALAAYETKAAAEKAAAPAAESYSAWLARTRAEAQAMIAARPAAPERSAAEVAEEQRRFEIESAKAQAEQAAAYRAADYREIETPAEAYRIEREADRRHEDT